MKKGTLGRSDHQPALTGADFVCDFVKDSDVKQIVDNCVNAATEAVLGKVRDTSMSLKLRANMHEACLTGDEVVDLMLANKSKASGLSEQNLPSFRLVRQHRKKGAIEVNEAAARELESGLDGSEDSLTMLKVGVLATMKTADQRKLLLVVTPCTGDALALIFNLS
eukprot:contig_14670_g3527